ncbi:hypothetical protein [Chamaesiphon sp. VAR_48_metabat_403]|uniref:hypothetical protein n=1 Tax=Chamaesiphon sp. VAR_48_metabat_403 TaxID=2964700 RepID=UPI00286E37AB|nr:hypothetical protein [Chamaesiphon sp. VAR_48_metabat_403]
MTKFSPDKTVSKNQFGGELIIYWGTIWATIALVLYLNFSVVDPQATRPMWFIIATTSLEEIGLLIAGCLCWRNWRSKYIAGGSAVWLLYALANFAFFIGNLWFTLWELLWKLDPAASLGNIFFVLFYLMTIAGVRLAILDRDVRLIPQQWAIVISVVALGLTIGCWLTAGAANATIAPPATAIVSTRDLPPSGSSIATSEPQILATASGSSITLATSQRPPEWVLAIDRSLNPLVKTFNMFYVLCDLVLLTLATILFLGFWGGQMGLPWRMTAQAVLCFYIADTWFAYANERVQGYESGFIMEVFWIFGIVQFGIAAALEFDNSIRARRLARRRTAIK